jgi:hypothetical protein
MGTIKGDFEGSCGFPQVGTTIDKAAGEEESFTWGVLAGTTGVGTDVAARDGTAMGTLDGESEGSHGFLGASVGIAIGMDAGM